MTVIVINAISVREGGSLVVLRELLASMVKVRPGWQWVVVANSDVKDLLPEFEKVEYLSYPKIDQHAWRVRLWYEFGLPCLLRKVGASLLFSHTNYLPKRKTPCGTLLLVQHAGHFSGVFSRLTENRLNILAKISWRLKGYWVKSSVCRADLVTVQTQALARRIISKTGCTPSHVRVATHGSGQVFQQATMVKFPNINKPLRVGYVTKAGVQKNFAPLFAAVEQLKNKGISLKLVLTLSKKVADNRAILELSQQYGIGDFIENHGELSCESIHQLYRTLHVFVFPSLCESFGFPMVEAMANGIPLLVADVDSNIEVAGAGGISFPAHDQNELANSIERLANDAEWFKQRARASLARSADFCWTTAATRTISHMDEVLADGLRGTPRCQ